MITMMNERDLRNTVPYIIAGSWWGRGREDWHDRGTEHPVFRTVHTAST